MKLTSMTDFVLNQKQSESFNEKTLINDDLIYVLNDNAIKQIVI